MDSETASVKSYTDSEEDDYGCYFLQPSSSPYNLMEKVQQANVDLFSSSPFSKIDKCSKVKFRDKLVSFEPELTDDDVNSIESDYIVTKDDIEKQSPVLEYKTTIIINNSPTSNIEDKYEEDEEVEDTDEIIEEIVGDEEFTERALGNIKKQSPKVSFIETFAQAELSKGSSKSSKRKKQSKSKYLGCPSEVDCKEHCIDKLECDLSMSIKKLDIHEKFQLPPLQLLQRKCCDEVKQKVPKTLPRYNGLRSEYGLSSRQLEKRERQKQIIKMKEEMRQQLMKEYKKRKTEQNEEVFCQWLKQVAKRKVENVNSKQIRFKETVGPNIVTLSSKVVGKTKERPKTANEFVPKTLVKRRRRPHTTQSCVYIEVPQGVFESELTLGNFVVTNSKLFSKNLHLLAVN